MNNKLREALEEMESVLSTWIDHLPPFIQVKAQEALDKADEVLAEQEYEAKWKLGAEYEYAYCSHCGHEQFANWDTYSQTKKNIGEFHKEYKFCPNCGFEMKESANDENYD